MQEVPTIQDLETVVGNIMKSALAFAGVALFVMIVVGAVRYITSGGDPKAAEGAKKTITYAIGGLLLAVLSYLILFLIGKFTGVDVSQFKLVQ
jgi:hypothetical protein